ncbi:MAG: 23S rRNA pseudouridine(1911/1915/1917) synthase RluD [Succinivibrionaceae bacterium]
MSEHIELSATVTDDLHGKRFDQIISNLFSDYSRSRLKEWILNGVVKVDGKILTVPKEKLCSGQIIQIETFVEEEDHFIPQDIPLNIIFEDDDMLVIDKPAGLTVHPGAGCHSGTLLNGLLYKYPSSKDLPRAGIVHRLDKDTSGLMVVAKTLRAVHKLVKAISKHDVVREYEAIAVGHMTAGGTVDEPIGRHATNRVMMAVKPEGLGKEAITHYRVMEQFRAHTRLRLRLETGRTHQIRVHMAHIKHPLVGDPVYGGKRARFIPNATPEFTKVINTFPRQALHATLIEFVHPFTGENMSFSSPIPKDIVELIEVLRTDTKEHPDDIVWAQ